MKNIYKNIIVLSILCFQLTSCDIDKVVPLNALVQENVITDETSAQNFLNRIYNTSIKNNGFYDRSSDPAAEAFGASLTISGTEGLVVGATTPFASNTATSQEVELEGVYKNAYFSINNANVFIELIEQGDAKVTEARENEFIAEAKFFRALSHFNLLRTFGQFYDVNSAFGVVVSDAPILGPISNPRNTVQEGYDLIISDLEFAAANAPSFRDHFYVTKTTAQALLSKVQLYMGDYTNAATNALAVINNEEGYALNPDYTDIFISRWTEETLLAPYVDILEGGSSIALYNRTSTGPSLIFRNLADEQVGTATDGDIVGNTSGYDPRFIFGFDVNSPALAGHGKYPFSVRFMENSIQVLRMAEVYLIYAEAEARRPGGVLADALEKLNDIRNRAGGIAPKTLSDQATLLEDIRNEKMLELFFELGESWFDLVRYDRLGDVSASALKSSITNEDKLIFPIPRTALIGNTELEPNPGQQ